MSKQKVRSIFGPLERDDGSFTTGDLDTAETLNRFFESIFTQEDISQVPVPEFRNVKVLMTLILLRQLCYRSYQC